MDWPNLSNDEKRMIGEWVHAMWLGASPANRAIATAMGPVPRLEKDDSDV